MGGNGVAVESGTEFALEASPKEGGLPDAVVGELVRMRNEVLAVGQAYGEAIRVQAEKYGVKAGALRRYIAALEADKTDDLWAVTSDLAVLLSGAQ